MRDLFALPINLLSLSGATVAALALSGTAEAAIIGADTLSTAGGYADIFRKPEFSVEIQELNSLGLVVNSTPVFSTTLTKADIGNTFKISPRNSSNFEDVEALLTNGTAEELAFRLTGQLGGSQAVGGFESNFTQDGATDFQGFFIDRLTVTVNSFDADIPGSDPNNDGIWTDYRAQYSFKVAGEPVPEPSSVAGTMALLGLGAFVAGKKAVRGKKVMIK